MIAFLDGTVHEKELGLVVVNVGGVGYLVHVSSQTNLPPAGGRLALRCHTHVREDAIQIFGFEKAEELRVFQMLILVSGIGPKLALAMLSGLPVDQLVAAIHQGDHKRLQTIPGVGKKTAQRVVLELKEKFAKVFGAGVPGPSAGPATTSSQDVVDALVNLGYRKPLAEKAVKKAVKAAAAGSGPEELLREALKAITEVSRG